MELKTIHSSEDVLFEKVWEIYQYSFPVHEKRKLANQREALAKENCAIDVYSDNGKVVGFLIYWVFDTFVYLEHYAMNKECRNQGYGSKILKAFIEHHRPRTVILDIDPFEDEISERRLHFYLRLGFVRNIYLHVHPPYNNPEGEKFTLILMSEGRALSQEEFDEFKNALYTQIVTYGER